MYTQHSQPICAPHPSLRKAKKRQIRSRLEFFSIALPLSPIAGQFKAIKFGTKHDQVIFTMCHGVRLALPIPFYFFFWTLQNYAGKF